MMSKTISTKAAIALLERGNLTWVECDDVRRLITEMQARLNATATPRKRMANLSENQRRMIEQIRKDASGGQVAFWGWYDRRCIQSLIGRGLVITYRVDIGPDRGTAVKLADGV